LRQREVATRLGLTTGAAVCLQLKRLQSVLDHDRDLRYKVAAMEHEIRGLSKPPPPERGFQETQCLQGFWEVG